MGPEMGLGAVIMLLKFFGGLIFLLSASAWANSGCTIHIKRMNVSETGFKRIDEVREYNLSMENKQSCFQTAQERLSYYPSNRSYYGSILNGDPSDSFLRRGEVDVYYFAEYEFSTKTEKSGTIKNKGRLQRSSDQMGMNPIMGKSGEILLN